MDKDEYEKELVRMWDSLRKNHKGEQSCEGVKCRECPFRKNGECISDSFEVVETVEKWSKENPPKKFKVSQLEYDIMRAAIDYSCEEEAFKDVDILYELLINGYFKGAKSSDKVIDFFKNCEVSDDV